MGGAAGGFVGRLGGNTSSGRLDERGDHEVEVMKWASTGVTLRLRDEVYFLLAADQLADDRGQLTVGGIPIT